MAGQHGPALNGTGEGEDGGLVVPGVLLALPGGGVPDPGPRGARQTDAALALMHEGLGTLVADDAVMLRREGDALVGRCPRNSQGLMAVRDLGVVDAAALCGDSSVSARCAVRLVVELQPESGSTTEDALLHGRHDHIEYLGVTLPRVRFTATSQRPVAALIHAAAAIHLRESTRR